MPSVPDSLIAAARALRREHLANLFASDPTRVARMTLDWDDWRVDFSKERLSPDALSLLLAHAETCNVPHWIAAQAAGEKINLSENRPALHTALRQRDDTPLFVDGHDVIHDIRATQARMRDIAGTFRDGRRKGATGLPLRTVVHIGIGFLNAFSCDRPIIRGVVCDEGKFDTAARSWSAAGICTVGPRFA